MTTKIKFSNWNFILFTCISFYAIGAGFVESLVNYPVWYIIGPSDMWINYHTALGSKIIPVLAVPALLLQLVPSIFLIFFRPIFIPRWTVWVILILLLVGIISSFVIQIPIQMELDKGYTKELIDRLISTDLLLRVLPGILRGILIIYMFHCLIRNSMKQRFA